MLWAHTCKNSDLSRRRVEVRFSIGTLTESKAWRCNPCPFFRPEVDNSSLGITGLGKPIYALPAHFLMHR